MDLIYRNPHYHHHNNPKVAYMLANPEETFKKSSTSRGNTAAPYYQLQQQEQLQQLLHQKLQEQLQKDQPNKQQLQQQLQAREQLSKQLQQQPKFFQTNQHQQQQKSPAGFSSNYFDVVEEEGRFLMYTDLPGCKVDDVKIALLPTGVLQIEGERKRGKNPKKFNRKFAVDDRLVDPVKITATLAEGTLEISAPKKQITGPRKIPVMVGSPPKEDLAYALEVDLPGVSTENLAVVLKEDKLFVVGQRTRGGQLKKFQQAFAVDSRTVETSKMIAYLEDGVLTLCAPKKDPIIPRLIPINGKLTKKEVPPPDEIIEDKAKAKSEYTSTAPNRIPLEVLLQLLSGAPPSEELPSQVEKPQEASMVPPATKEMQNIESDQQGQTPSDTLREVIRNAVATIDKKGTAEEEPSPYLQGVLNALQEALLEATSNQYPTEAKVQTERTDDEDDSVPPTLEAAEETSKNTNTGHTVTLQRLTPLELMKMFPGLFLEEEQQEEQNDNAPNPPEETTPSEEPAAKDTTTRDTSVAATKGDSEISDIDSQVPVTNKEEEIEEGEILPSVTYADIVKNDPAVEEEPVTTIERENKDTVEGAKRDETEDVPTAMLPTRVNPESDYHIVPETVTDDDDD